MLQKSTKFAPKQEPPEGVVKIGVDMVIRTLKNGE